MYIFGGSFLVSEGAILRWPLSSDNILRFENFLIGVTTILLSCLIHYHTLLAANDLAKIKNAHINYKDLAKAFNASDASNNGKLDTVEFIAFLKRIGVELSHEDLETALQGNFYF